MDVLSDYIIALVENRNVEDSGQLSLELKDQLQVFLYDNTQCFVKELIEFLDTFDKEGDKKEEPVNDVSGSEVEDEEVDYEEEESIEAVTLPSAGPKRLLREYSPERRSEPPKSASESTPSSSRMCVNFSRFGSCRFGDNCRYSHYSNPTVNLRRRNVSSRVKLSNLPPSMLSPAAITEIMKNYGSVVSVTVYPERGEALVQYSSGEEASAALEGAIEDFKSDEVVIELETMNSYNNTKKNTMNRRPSFDKLQTLINLQKQQQSLLESNLSSQQSLLTHLANPALSTEDRTELLSTLKRVQESVTAMQEMLKRTTELVVQAAANDKPTPRATNTITMNLKRNNNVFSNNTNYTNYSNSNSFKKTFNNATSYSNPTSYHPQSFNVNTHKNSLDLRPTTLKLGPLSLTDCPDIRSLQARFSPYGLIQSLILVDGGQTALIKYQKHTDAQKAFEAKKREFEEIDGLEFIFIKQ